MDRIEPLSRIRQLIASRLVESLRVAAQLTTVVEIDLTNVSELRSAAKAQFEQERGLSLSFLPFFCRATLDALIEHPRLNASVDIEQGTVTYHGAQHLGVAVDTDAGLLVPVIRDAGDLGLVDLAHAIRDLATRARQRKLLPDELKGSTFTITNTGSRGALFDTPIINLPEVAILGTGAVVRRPVVMNVAGREAVVIRSVANFAITYDHRLVDGADAARFLMSVKQRLEVAAYEQEMRPFMPKTTPANR